MLVGLHDLFFYLRISWDKSLQRIRMDSRSESRRTSPRYWPYNARRILVSLKYIYIYILVGGLEHEVYDFPFSWNFMIPTNDHQPVYIYILYCTLWIQIQILSEKVLDLTPQTTAQILPEKVRGSMEVYNVIIYHNIS